MLHEYEVRPVVVDYDYHGIGLFPKSSYRYDLKQIVVSPSIFEWTTRGSWLKSASRRSGQWMHT
jgi:hypothetical protein